MTSTDIIAYLGAAAWTPQIISWLYNAYKKPTVTIIPDKSVSIGYTTFGSIFNLRLFLNVKKKDILVDFLGVDICHENNAKYSFEWVGMTEVFSEIKSNTGQHQVAQRDTSPIALKLHTLFPIERFFKFQNSEFLTLSKPIIIKLFEHKSYMQKNNQNYHNEFLRCKEFDEYMKFMREKFFWQAGNYTVSFRLRSTEKIKFKADIFQFQLTQDDIDSLQKNIQEIKTDLEYLVKKPDLPEFSGQIANWNWRTVDLKKIV